jgi:WD40 repeat protein
MINQRPYPSHSMSPDELSLQKTLEGHTAAITVVEFSPDGKFLASAGDDGAVLIFSTSSWTPMHRFVDVSPVSVLAWHQNRRYLLFCGHQSGDLHLLTMTKSMVRRRNLTCPVTSLRYVSRNSPSSRLQHSPGVFVHCPSPRHLLVLP